MERKKEINKCKGSVYWNLSMVYYCNQQHDLQRMTLFIEATKNKKKINNLN